jgi:hypothetical protein
MGTLFYGSQRTPIPVGDRLLAHLSIITTTKMRRREGLVLSWKADSGPGSNIVWIPAEAELHFVFDAEPTTDIDRALLDALVVESSKPSGINLSEPILVQVDTGPAMTSIHR